MPDPTIAEPGDPVRPGVAVVAHAVDDRGGQERVTAEVIRRSSDDVTYHVVAGTLAPDLEGRVVWHRIPMPPGPFVLRYVWFGVLAGMAVARLRRSRDLLVHSAGAVIPNRVDVASVHYCWAEAVATGARRAPSGLARRLNQWLTTRASVAAERWCFRPGRLGVAAAVSERTAGEIRRHYPGTDVVVVPNGVDIDRFRPDPGMRGPVRRELGSAEDSFAVLFVGGDWGRKGLDAVIEAVGRLVGGQRTVELWVAGGGDRAWAEDLARKAGCAGRLRLLGFRSDVERLYAAADVLVIPSRYETFGLVALEAAAAGLPVVTTAGSAPAEVVDRLEGWLVVDGSADSITDALRRLESDAGTAAEIGISIRPAAAALSWDRAVTGTLAAYELARRGGSAHEPGAGSR